MTLCLKNLGFERNNQSLLSQINCMVSPGECLQIYGANGSGKSTLLRIIAGFIEPHIGQVLWQNKCIFATHDGYKKNIHYVGHQNGIKPSLTVQENLQLNSALLGNASPPADSLFSQIGLLHCRDTKAALLSAGQLRRLSLARLLIMPFKVWLLDEPLTALDVAGQNLLAQLLNHHLANGGIGILATHHALHLAHPVKIIQLGI